MSATAAANVGGGPDGGGGGRAGAVLDALVEVPVGVGEGRVGGDDAGDGAAAQLAVVLLVARSLPPKPARERQTSKTVVTRFCPSKIAHKSGLFMNYHRDY